MDSNKRKYPRHDLNLSVSAELSDGSKITCRVCDISQSGARLAVEDSHKLSNEFRLVLSPQLEHQCQVIWRSNQTAGVKFLPKPAVDGSSSDGKIVLGDMPRSR